MPVGIGVFDGEIVKRGVRSGDVRILPEAEIRSRSGREDVPQQSAEFASGPCAGRLFLALLDRLVVDLQIAVIFLPVLVDYLCRHHVLSLPIRRAGLGYESSRKLLADVIRESF